MSTETNDTNPVDMDDLDAFENAFFNKEPKTEAKAEVEEPQDDSSEDEDEVDEIGEDAPATEDDEEPEVEEEEEDEEPEPEPKPKGKKSAKDRIEELVAKTREAERRETALLKRLEMLEARKEEVPEKAPVPLREALSKDAPSPDAEDKDGEPLYPLGEFDPLFIRDLTRFTIRTETEAAKAQDAETEQQRMVAAAQEELRVGWMAKVESAEKELPDLREKLDGMSVAFENIDPNYGEYLAATIMSCDAGAQIMYYLSQNIGEAQKIVASGPAAATLAIGRLEARLTPTKTEEPKRNIKQVSKAPIPPEQRTRGAGSKFSVNADTDDLDAFEREFFKKK